MHARLIQHMQEQEIEMPGLPNNKGVCYGIAYMAVQAILSDDIDTFDRRIAKLNMAPKELLVQINRVKEARKKRQPITRDSDLLYEEIPAFLEGVELCQQGYLRYSLFTVNKPKSQQDIMLMVPLVFSQALEKRGGLTEIITLTGAYEENELSLYFKLLDNSLKNHSHSVAIVLSISNHAITVGYDPIHKEWLFVDANELPTQRFPVMDIVSITKKILSAYLTESEIRNNNAIFATKIYGTESSKQELMKCINHLTQENQWKLIHTISPKKAALLDSINSSWLYIAAQQGHIDVVNALIDAGANVNLLIDNDIRPLFVAAENGHLDVVKALIKANANLNLGIANGATPLFVAAQKGHLAIVNELIAAGANIDLARVDDGVTPLIMSVNNGHPNVVSTLIKAGAKINLAMRNGCTSLIVAAQSDLDVVRELINAGANVNLAMMDGATPLFVAAKNGNKEIIELLFNNGADPTFAYNGTADLLHDFAEENQVKERVGNLIKKKQTSSSSIISVTPEEIAIVMGHLEIAHMLGEASKKNITVFFYAKMRC